MTADQLVGIVPAIKKGSVAAFLPHLNRFMPDARYKIDTPARIGAFIAQVAEESINFSYVLERGTGAEYEMDLQLGNTIAGDGVMYKGRGLIQVTGKGNYRDCSLHIFGDLRLLDNPGLLMTPQYAVQSACWYWTSREINEVCDQPETYVHPGVHRYEKFQWITVKINGGLNGYTERLANYNRARQVLKF